MKLLGKFQEMEYFKVSLGSPYHLICKNLRFGNGIKMVMVSKWY